MQHEHKSKDQQSPDENKEQDSRKYGRWRLLSRTAKTVRNGNGGGEGMNIDNRMNAVERDPRRMMYRKTVEGRTLGGGEDYSIVEKEEAWNLQGRSGEI
ncbi:hypothetical protein M407DRAFT_240405 [Tulasnella calospora MUT 4182]|uniref:Uncharacterized protein n=1 Tax=Tulasnella calospora MUT 4182 TaxID=1051891 RepID=A0A0C3QYT0_9AGAM|nr:hypothetical protein M407DRAFT_240405 [Tulasnella calospora MUT 4182]